MINFLTAHIIGKIVEMNKEIFSDNKYTGFIWFDEPIIDSNFIIDRINLQCPIQKEEILPLSWFYLKPRTIFKIYNKIRNNQIYIKPKIDSYYIKIKPKNKYERIIQY